MTGRTVLAKRERMRPDIEEEGQEPANIEETKLDTKREGTRLVDIESLTDIKRLQEVEKSMKVERLVDIDGLIDV